MGSRVRSGGFSITAAAADHLSFAQPNTMTRPDSRLPACDREVLDKFGNRVTSNTSIVTWLWHNNPGSATLSGATSVVAVGGVATFGNLSLNKAAAPATR